MVLIKCPYCGAKTNAGSQRVATIDGDEYFIEIRYCQLDDLHMFGKLRRKRS